jgi:2,3-bisphosphoglycerate-independent phosphoglycerate mutase
MYAEIPDSLVTHNDTKILLLVLDGLGGLARDEHSGTELQVACCPNLDALAARSSCGLLTPIAPGITPGSGPGHFGLFGYDPVKANIGRGVQEAAGISFPLQDIDVAVRFNFATVDKEGRVIDRRAGRISTEENARIVGKLREGVQLDGDVELFIETVKEHRGVVVFRGAGLGGDIEDTDPQRIGARPLDPVALTPDSESTAQLAKQFIEQAGKLLRDEEKGNMLLFRGFAKNAGYPSLEERFGLRSAAIATYPVYKGIALLLGMTVIPDLKSFEEEVEALRQELGQFDFFFVHFKYTDSRGEDGDFQQKVKAIEAVDAIVPEILSLDFDVVVVTGDHSTPARMASHSWHEIPVVLWADTCRVDAVATFDELSCINGSLGRLLSKDLLTVAVAHAGRLDKFGA